MPMLVSRATFVQSQTVPSAVKSFIKKQRVKCEHKTQLDRHVVVSWHTEAEASPCHLSSSIIQPPRLQVGD